MNAATSKPTADSSAAIERRPCESRAVHVTLLFSDIVGFTGAIERLGDVDGLVLLKHYQEAIRRELRRYGAEELELRGDGFLAALGVPARGLTCAVAIQNALAAERLRHPQEAVHARVGVHCGPVLRDEGHYFGKTVIVAARIAELACRDEVLASAQVRDLVRCDAKLDFEQPRHVMLKGLQDPYLVYRVAAADDPESRLSLVPAPASAG